MKMFQKYKIKSKRGISFSQSWNLLRMKFRRAGERHFSPEGKTPSSLLCRNLSQGFSFYSDKHVLVHAGTNLPRLGWGWWRGDRQLMCVTEKHIWKCGIKWARSNTDPQHLIQCIQRSASCLARERRLLFKLFKPQTGGNTCNTLPRYISLFLWSSLDV